MNSDVLSIFQLRNPGKTLSSDRLISARGSWALGQFDLLFPRGEDSMPDVSIVIDINR